MEISNFTKKINTFRLIQLEIFRRHSKNAIDRILNIPNITLIFIASIATISTFEIAQRTGTVWASLLALGIQTIAVAFFFIEPKLDFITTRLLLFSYLLFYLVVVFTHTGTLFPLDWVFTYVLFAYVGAGGKESFIWIGAHFSIILIGIVRQQMFMENKIPVQDIRLFIYAYVLIAAFAFVLDYATKLTSIRVGTQTKQLEESNARYDVILNSIGDGLIATDSRGIVEFVNKEAINLLRIERKELIGQPLTAVVLAKDQNGKLIPHKDRLITKVLSTGELLSINQTSKDRYFFIKGDGSQFPASTIVSPVKVVDQLRGAIMLFHDMSVEEQIDRAKSEFVSLASHQLRTPLNVVSWYVEKLLSQRKGVLNEHQQGYLQEVATNNERMIRLVSDLLNVSRVELGRIKIKREPVNLTKLLPALIKEVEPLIDQKKLNFTKPNESFKGLFSGSDESIVMVIIQNLLSNAIKYTPDGGNITLKVTEKLVGIPQRLAETLTEVTEGVIISVSDSGIGIPLEQQDKIFSKLFRADNVQSLDVSGTGLGLYVTQSFVEALGGRIWFESKPGVGTTFSAYLPYEVRE